MTRCSVLILRHRVFHSLRWDVKTHLSIQTVFAVTQNTFSVVTIVISRC
jgi:hypothetical protein